MKNMKLNILLIGLLFSAGTQVAKTNTNDLDNAIHTYLVANTAHLQTLKAAKMAEVKAKLTELFNDATEEEKEAYREVIQHLEEFNPEQLMKELSTLRKIVTALKNVNTQAYDVIKKNLPKMIAAFV